MSNERPTRAQIAAAQEIGEAIERQQGGIYTVSDRLLSSWAQSIGVAVVEPIAVLRANVRTRLTWLWQHDERGNWIGTTAGEDGYAP